MKIKRDYFFQDGQYVYVDWLPQKEADSSKLTSNQNKQKLKVYL